MSATKRHPVGGRLHTNKKWKKASILHLLYLALLVLNRRQAVDHFCHKQPYFWWCTVDLFWLVSVLKDGISRFCVRVSERKKPLWLVQFVVFRVFKSMLQNTLIESAQAMCVSGYALKIHAFFVLMRMSNCGIIFFCFEQLNAYFVLLVHLA